MDKTKKFFQVAGRAAYVVFLRWGILVVSTIFLMWYLQYRVSGNDAGAVWTFLDEKPTVFWYSALILFFITMFFYGIFHRPFKTIGVAFALITIITYINNTKMSFRGTPLLPEDFQLADQAGTLTKFIDFSVLVRVILASILSIGLGCLLDYLTKEHFRILPKLPKLSRKKPKTAKAKLRRRKIIALKATYFITPRLIIIPLALVGLCASTGFITHRGSESYQEIAWLDHTQFVMWNQTINYQDNGFILGFIYNLNKATLEEPEGYSKNKISDIKSKYQEEAQKEPNTNRKKIKDSDYNIVIILNESYYDASLIQVDYPFVGGDLLPTFHEVMKKHPAGYMYSTDYGGGTANIEFEVDTGLSNYWAKTVPYTDILPKIDDVVSIAKDAKNAGYKTTAIHSFTGGMYKRDFALKREGFDRFITEVDMKYQEHDGDSEYINDRSIYQETLDVLKDSKEKQLVSVITMQNHAPYYKSSYKGDEYVFRFESPGDGSDFNDVLLAYLQTLHSADAYLGEFLEELYDMDEKTVVLFYGDHAPGLFAYAHQLQNEKVTNLTQLTPYFIWTNFEIKDSSFANKKYGKEFLEKFGEAYASVGDSEKNAANMVTMQKLSKNITLPTTTPNCLTNTMYNVLNLRLNAEGELLRQVCTETPILSHFYLGSQTPTGKATKDYELLNYDILGGKQYWFK